MAAPLGRVVEIPISIQEVTGLDGMDEVQRRAKRIARKSAELNREIAELQRICGEIGIGFRFVFGEATINPNAPEGQE